MYPPDPAKLGERLCLENALLIFSLSLSLSESQEYAKQRRRRREKLEKKMEEGRAGFLREGTVYSWFTWWLLRLPRRLSRWLHSCFGNSTPYFSMFLFLPSLPRPKKKKKSLFRPVQHRVRYSILHLSGRKKKNTFNSRALHTPTKRSPILIWFSRWWITRRRTFSFFLSSLDDSHGYRS